jgi:hypothetical protein
MPYSGVMEEEEISFMQELEIFEYLKIMFSIDRLFMDNMHHQLNQPNQPSTYPIEYFEQMKDLVHKLKDLTVSKEDVIEFYQRNGNQFPISMADLKSSNDVDFQLASLTGIIQKMKAELDNVMGMNDEDDEEEDEDYGEEDGVDDYDDCYDDSSSGRTPNDDRSDSMNPNSHRYNP